MIKVSLKADEFGYRGFEATGHAEYAGKGENDILCAACSVLMINTVNSIERLAEDKVLSEEEKGVLKCEFPEGLSEKGKLLMDSMVMGLEDIVHEFGERYLQIERSDNHRKE